MKKTIKTLSILMVVLAFSLTAMAQSATVRTATTAAMPTGAGLAIVAVASSSGMTASTTATPTYLAICDGQDIGGFPPCEMMLTVSISGNNVTVRRGQISTLPTAHVTGSIVWYGTRGNFANGNTTSVFVTPTPGGQCTRTLNTSLPVINYLTGDISDCIVSLTLTTDQWVTLSLGQRANFLPLHRLPFGTSGSSAAYTALITDTIIGINTATATTITLPACTGCGGKFYYILDMNGGVANAPTTVTIAGSSGQLVNSGTSATLVPSAVRNQAGWVFYDDYSNSWYVGQPGNLR